MKMFVFVVFLFLVCFTSANEDKYDTLWNEFKENYSKVYKSLREDKYRADVFKTNLRTIEEHNDRYKAEDETYFLGINEFTDLTDEEFGNIYLNYRSEEKIRNEISNIAVNLSIPASVDWRSKGVLFPVRSQGNCGSCWAFSAVAALEGQNAIKHKRKIPLSEQDLVDCSGRYNNHGCRGGLMDSAFKYIKANGISTRASYPYHAKNEACHKKRSKANVKVTGIRDIGRSESALQNAVASVGPISVAINANLIKSYKGGVFSNKNCKGALNHAVVAVGYGSGYWIVRNSWGSSWGEHGHIRIARNKGNMCGIASEASYPITA